MPKPGKPLPTLVLSFEGATCEAGLAADGCWVGRRSSHAGAVEGLAPLVREVLGGSGLDSVERLVYSAGPGSILGLRAGAAMVQTWLLARPGLRLARFSGLVLAARCALAAGTPPPFTLISPWKKGFWNVLRAESPEVGIPDLAVEETEALPGLAAPFLLLPLRKSWETPPVPTRPAAIDLSPLAGWLEDPSLVEPVDRIDLLEHRTNVFAKWTPARHPQPET